MMLIGAVNLTLKILHGGCLSLGQGRLLHAAFLNWVRTVDPVLSEELHNGNQNPFAIGMLQKLQAEEEEESSSYYAPNTLVNWRLAGLATPLTELIQALPLGTIFKVGTLQLQVTEKLLQQTAANDCGCVSMEELAEGCFALPRMHSLTLSFSAPTAFHYFDADYPFPKPDLVFGSLVDKWNRFSDGLQFDAKIIRELAANRIIPDQWQGRTLQVRMTDKRSTKCFLGKFTYNLQGLKDEEQKIFLLLGEYAKFSGVGRMTGQGFGRVRISYK